MGSAWPTCTATRRSWTPSCPGPRRTTSRSRTTPGSLALHGPALQPLEQLAGDGRRRAPRQDGGKRRHRRDLNVNTITGAVTSAVDLSMDSSSTSAARFTAHVLATTIGNATALSGSAQGSAVRVRAGGAGTMTTAIREQRRPRVRDARLPRPRRRGQRDAQRDADAQRRGQPGRRGARGDPRRGGLGDRRQQRGVCASRRGGHPEHRRRQQGHGRRRATSTSPSASPRR